MLKIQTLVVVGVGLIGGSLARAARLRGVAEQILGIEADESHHERAVALSLVDVLAQGPDEADVSTAQVVVWCVPVARICDQLRAVASRCRPGTLLTDTGSTKSAIVADLEATLPPGFLFIGSHPLAGSEKRGPQHSDPHLFEGRLVVLTPTPRTEPAALDRATAFWEALGARVRRMRPEEHDRALALTSHLPHLVASALAGTLPPELFELAASGFRDTTRLAASDPQLWLAICRQNRLPLLD